MGRHVIRGEEGQGTFCRQAAQGTTAEVLVARTLQENDGPTLQDTQAPSYKHTRVGQDRSRKGLVLYK